LPPAFDEVSLGFPIEVEPDDRLIDGLETTGAGCVVVVGGATTGARVTGVDGAAGVVTTAGGEMTGAETTGGVVTTGLALDCAEPDWPEDCELDDWVPRYWVAVDGAIGITAGA
jgi:hypothetical protein